ncbi:MAG TPA: flagellar export chaperone FliS [Acidimicrobiia bacterium]|nr:flagellar export chaperone FliS [Acidimicrobiia bacterium]
MNGGPVYAVDAGHHYAQTEVSTVSPARLVLLMYDAVLSAVEIARTALTSERPDLGVVSQQLTRAQQLVTELEVALDHERGGQIAASLQSLYVYARQRLVDANLAKDHEPLDHVTRIIGDLREAWAASALGLEQ